MNDVNFNGNPPARRQRRGAAHCRNGGRGFRDRRGLSLIEMLLGVVVLGLLCASVSVLVPQIMNVVEPRGYVAAHLPVLMVASGTEGSLSHGAEGRGGFAVASDGLLITGSAVPDGWSWYDRAPAVKAGYRAGEYFVYFLEMLEAADWSVVLGGVDEVPNEPPAEGASAMFFTAMPEDGEVLYPTGHHARGLLPDLADQFMPERKALFTVLSFRGGRNLIGVAEVFRDEEEEEGLAGSPEMMKALYSANLWWRVGGVWQLKAYYRCYVPALYDSWAIPPGARHAWRRYDLDWRIFDEGPCRVVFPDPGVSPGQGRDGDMAAMSRYVYFVE